jgi:DNA-binding NtrC family response regulator
LKAAQADLILLDVTHSDGETRPFLKEQSGGLNAVPVLLMTGPSEAAPWAQVPGVAGLLEKPLDAADLLEQVRRHLG